MDSAIRDALDAYVAAAPRRDRQRRALRTAKKAQRLSRPVHRQLAVRAPRMTRTVPAPHSAWSGPAPRNRQRAGLAVVKALVLIAHVFRNSSCSVDSTLPPHFQFS